MTTDDQPPDQTLRGWASATIRRDADDLVAFTLAFIGLFVVARLVGFRPTVLAVLAMLLAGWFDR